MHDEAVAQQRSSYETKFSPLEANGSQIKTVFHLFKTQSKTIVFRMSLDSRIVPHFARPFVQFRDNRFVLLWRGSHDGFAARDFHSRCDDHTSTFTLILDTTGNICGGLTPVEWEFCSGKYKCDNTLTPVLFALKKPHKTPAIAFALQPERRESAIYPSPSYCLTFGVGLDLSVSSQCNTNARSSTSRFGSTDTNNSGVANDKLFTGSSQFKV
jgi:hypothetical protein